jgi:hypothetical protein
VQCGVPLFSTDSDVRAKTCLNRNNNGGTKIARKIEIPQPETQPFRRILIQLRTPCSSSNVNSVSARIEGYSQIFNRIRGMICWRGITDVLVFMVPHVQSVQIGAVTRTGGGRQLNWQWQGQESYAVAAPRVTRLSPYQDGGRQVRNRGLK